MDHRREPLRRAGLRVRLRLQHRRPVLSPSAETFRMETRAALDLAGRRAPALRRPQRAAHRMDARSRRGAHRDGRRRGDDRQCIPDRQPRRFFRPALRRIRGARRRHRRIDLAAVLAGDRKLVRRATRTRDGSRVRGHFARRRVDDDGRQLRDLARRMARGLRHARDPDVRHCDPVDNHRRAHPPAAGRGRQRRASERRAARLRNARSDPHPFILDDLGGAVLLRRRRSRRGTASDHLSH